MACGRTILPLSNCSAFAPCWLLPARVVNAIGLALATCLVLVTSNTAVSLIRNIVSDAVRLPVVRDDYRLRRSPASNC